MSRIDSTNIAFSKSKKKICSRCIMASSAFRDNVDLASNGVSYYSTGGSINDDEIIRIANKHKLAMFSHTRVLSTNEIKF